MSPVLQPFTLPLPRGDAPAATLAMIGTPSPQIGAIVCATSTLDLHGSSTLMGSRGVPLRGRVLFSLLLAVVGGLVAGAPAGYGITQALPPAMTKDFGALAFSVPLLLLAALVGLVTFRLYGHPKRAGECVYVGAEGVEKVRYDHGEVTRAAARYVDQDIVLRAMTKVFINNVYRHDRDELQLVREGGRRFTLLGYHREKAGLSAESILVREAARLAAIQRAPRARARLAKGEPVTFSIFVGEGGGARPSSKRLEMHRDRIELHDTSASPSLQQSFPRASTSARLDKGKLTITSAQSPDAGASFPLSLVGDADVFLLLLEEGR